VDKQAVTITRKPTPDERIRAAEWLADRGFGRPAQTVETSTPPLTHFNLILEEPK